jgi:hypothetical protein
MLSEKLAKVREQLKSFKEKFKDKYPLAPTEKGEKK